MQTWFECKVKYIKTLENGKEQTVNENFLLDAVSFTDAETRMIRQMQQIVRGEFNVTDIKKSKIAEVFPYEQGEWWFKAILSFVTIDETAGREKKIRSTYLVMADDINQALQRLDESLSYMVIPYVITSLATSNIIDVFPYEPSESVIPPGYTPLSAEHNATEN